MSASSASNENTPSSNNLFLWKTSVSSIACSRASIMGEASAPLVTRVMVMSRAVGLSSLISLTRTVRFSRVTAYPEAPATDTRPYPITVNSW